jgi:hypothetical protein
MSMTAEGYGEGRMHSIPIAMAGRPLSLKTNSTRLKEIATGFFPTASLKCAHPSSGNVSLLVRARRDQSRARCKFPIFRGRREYVHADYGRDGSVWFDLKARAVLGVLSDDLIADAEFFRRSVLAVIAGVLAPSLDVVALHTGCVVRNGKAVLLAAASGVGKSTLSLALAMRGWSLLSDEWTFVSGIPTELRAWGMQTSVKLLPDAVRYFPELCALSPDLAMNGELSFEVNPCSVFHVGRAIDSEPKAIVLLERDSRPRFAAHCEVKHCGSEEARTTLLREIEEQPIEAIARNHSQSSVIESLCTIPSLKVRFCGHPAVIAAQLDPILTELVSV